MINILVSDCCGKSADDFLQEMKRCSDCKESCEYVTEEQRNPQDTPQKDYLTIPKKFL